MKQNPACLVSLPMPLWFGNLAVPCPKCHYELLLQLDVDGNGMRECWHCGSILRAALSLTVDADPAMEAVPAAC